MSQADVQIAAVAIGRNEGPRLQRCLASLVGRVGQIVYVDSGSTDASVAMARAVGVEVVELDTSVPFTAARARNAGVARLSGDCAYVQFVDGDCEIVEGWLAAAKAALDGRSDLAVVCGRRRERFPAASVYNRIADIEWNTPVGEARACGGDAMMRLAAFRAVGGFNDSLICGEEPELCVRLRAAGWKVHRLDAEMTLHDAAMTRFSQWWKRAVRGGWAYAQGAAMHGRPPERHNVREHRSVWLWGLGLPLAAVGLAWPTKGLSLLLLLAYPAQMLRIWRASRRLGMSPADARAWAWSCTLGKFPQMVGQCRYWLHRLRGPGRRARLIEYKG